MLRRLFLSQSGIANTLLPDLFRRPATRSPHFVVSSKEDSSISAHVYANNPTDHLIVVQTAFDADSGQEGSLHSFDIVPPEISASGLEQSRHD